MEARNDSRLYWLLHLENTLGMANDHAYLKISINHLLSDAPCFDDHVILNF